MSQSTPMFDRYLFVDWSARTGPTSPKPAKDAIWVGQLTRGDPATETYCRTRGEATDIVGGLLDGAVRDGMRVLVGFDFPYGYPAGLAEHLPSNGRPAWRTVWDYLGANVEDDEKNTSNRFVVANAVNGLVGDGPGPFWGCPPKQCDNHAHLTSTMLGTFAFPYQTSHGALQRLRITEKAIGGVQETWKLLGAGSVGSQALLGIPRVLALREDIRFRAVSQVWPFETGFTATPVPDRGPCVLHAEIWPGIISKHEIEHEKEATDAIHDRAQVRLMCRWAARQDEAGTLGQWFDAPSLTPLARKSATEHEGWILGCAA